MRIVVLDDYQGVAERYAPWQELGADVVFLTRPISDDGELITVLDGAQVVVAMRERTPFTAARLASLPSLRLLVTTGRSNSAIDLGAARARGIIVCGTESPSSATPELTWGLILAVLRHIPQEHAAVRAGQWQSTIGGDLDGQVLGVVGLGRLGSKVARIGAAFGMDVIGWSQNLDSERAAAAGARAVSKRELFSSADVVTVHYKLSDRSRGIVGKDELGAMKPTAVVINTSRGPLVDTDALVAALHAGTIGGAGIDVFDQEPLPVGHPLRSAPRTVLTPHLGYVTEGTYRVFYPQAVEAIAAWVEGSPVRQLA